MKLSCVTFSFVNQKLDLVLGEAVHKFPSFRNDVWLRVCMENALNMDLCISER